MILQSCKIWSDVGAVLYHEELELNGASFYWGVLDKEDFYIKDRYGITNKELEQLRDLRKKEGE